MMNLTLFRVLSFAVLALAGCNLQSDPAATQPPPATLTPDLRCGDIPSGWVTYTIAPGDALSIIAERTGTSADLLAAVNCIDDPGRIIVGEDILVPGAGSGGAGTGSGGAGPLTVIDAGAVQLQPSSQQGASVVVRENEVITVSWPGAPVSSATRVEFYIDIPSAANAGQLTLMGTDTNMSDGAQIVLPFTGRMSGPVTATAVLSDGSVVTTSTSVTVLVLPSQ
jgi:LysM repeat protein